MPLQVKCPRCSKLITYSKDNLYRPFCSERCKLIDLGNWADGSYSIVAKPVDPQSTEHLQDPENQDSNENED
jgi:endogenous inhibitor of DNA gyrase (YacG/DUF329 family)